MKIFIIFMFNNFFYKYAIDNLDHKKQLLINSTLKLLTKILV